MPQAVAPREVEELLRTRGVRPTRQRVEVLRELSREGNDVTAQELWQRLHDRGGPPVALHHRACDHDVTIVPTCSHCGETLTARDVRVVPGPGATSPVAAQAE